MWLTTSLRGHTANISFFCLLGAVGEKKSSPWRLSIDFGRGFCSRALWNYIRSINRTYFETIYTLEDGWLEYGGCEACSCLLFVLNMKDLWMVRPWTFRVGLSFGRVLLWGSGELSWGSEFLATHHRLLLKIPKVKPFTLSIRWRKLNKLILVRG